METDFDISREGDHLLLSLFPYIFDLPVNDLIFRNLPDTRVQSPKANQSISNFPFYYDALDYACLDNSPLIGEMNGYTNISNTVYGTLYVNEKRMPNTSFYKGESFLFTTTNNGGYSFIAYANRFNMNY